MGHVSALGLSSVGDPSLGAGTITGFLHFGQAPFLPASVSGTLILCPQLTQANLIIVDRSGTVTALPHFGHFPFLPEHFWSTPIGWLHFEHAKRIMTLPLQCIKSYSSQLHSRLR